VSKGKVISLLRPLTIDDVLGSADRVITNNGSSTIVGELFQLFLEVCIRKDPVVNGLSVSFDIVNYSNQPEVFVVPMVDLLDDSRDD
jgi:hypothetical protein